MNGLSKWTVGSVLVVLIGMALLAWINNITVSLQWDPSQIGKEYEGLFPWLDWAAVDFSTASTSIPLLGLVLIAVGVVRICRPHEGKAPRCFPFFREYNEFTIAGGLIGTVIGLIMVGYYQQKQIELEDLMICMRTALYSTLVALVWVFLVVIWVQPLMRRWYDRTAAGVVGDQRDLVQRFHDLGQATAKAEIQLKSSAGHLAAFAKNVGTFHGTLSKVFGVLRQMENESLQRQQALRGLSNTLKQFEFLGWEARQELAEERKARDEALKTSHSALRELADLNRRKADSLERRLTRIHTAIRGFTGDNHGPRQSRDGTPQL